MTELWMPGAVRHLAHLIDDGPYLADVQDRLRVRYGTADEHDLAFNPIVDFPVGRATHSSQDGYDWNRLRYILEASVLREPVVPLLIRDGDRVMVYDGNHRYAAACLKQHKTIRVRMLTLKP